MLIVPLKQVLEYDSSFLKAKRQLMAVEALIMEKPVEEDAPVSL